MNIPVAQEEIQEEKKETPSGFFFNIRKSWKEDPRSRPIALYLGLCLILFFLVVFSLAPQISQRLGLFSQRKEGQQSLAQEKTCLRVSAKKIRGSGPSQKELKVELDLPDYYPEEYNCLQRVFSGRDIRLVGDFGEAKTFQGELRGKKTGEQKRLEVSRGEKKSLKFKIPEDTKTDSYDLFLTIGGETYLAPIKITGSEASAKQFSVDAGSQLSLSSAILYQKDLNCIQCYWELVMSGHPADSNHLALIGSNPNPLQLSHDGGQTWTGGTLSGLPYLGDPKSLVTNAGKFLLAADISLPHPADNTQYVISGGLFQGQVTGSSFNGTIVEGPPNDLTLDKRFVFDYGKIAYDENSGTIYVSSNFAYFNGTIGRPLFISRDGGQTFSKQQLNHGNTIMNMATTKDGLLRAVTTFKENQYLLRFNAQADTFNVVSGPNKVLGSTNVTRVSSTSSKGWTIYNGPVIAIDKSATSPHQGRIYILWSRPESIIQDPTFEFGSYSYNHDVYLAYSDDDGQTWSSAIKINDDSGKAEQVFPSMNLDQNGSLHIAFLDKRENPDAAQFDVYYTVFKDGKVAQNIRVNSVHVPNAGGGRVIGDYLDMVVAYPEKTYVAYPCEGSVDRPGDACVTAVDPRLLVFPPPPDQDTDGFPDLLEQYLGTDPNRACPQTATANDESLDPWPPDFNDNGIVEIDDAFFVSSRFNAKEGDANYTKRAELATQNGVIGIDDVNAATSRFNQSCSP